MTILLRELLELGHSVHFFGIPGFTEAPSLCAFPNYRYSALRVDLVERGWAPIRRIRNPVPTAAYSQFAHAAYHREAVRRIHAASRTERFDVVLCIDTLELWPSKLPVISWPQSPPQTEWAALRSPDIARRARQAAGRGRLLSVEGFYAFRWLQARACWQASRFILCGSAWSEESWVRFGVPRSRIRALPYPLDLRLFSQAPPPQASPRVTFLWLGRAAPRKRFDLFLSAFEQLADGRDDVRALVVGDLSPDPLATAAIANSRKRALVEQRASIPRAHVPALLAEADVLVQPSENENFGMSVAEALASGRPVVVGPTNGTADYAGAALFKFDAYTSASVATAMQNAALAVRSDPNVVMRAARTAAQRLAPRAVTLEVLRLSEEAVTTAKQRY
jgi:glycosyltransferase involved in cell wall biosynthesis